MPGRTRRNRRALTTTAVAGALVATAALLAGSAPAATADGSTAVAPAVAAGGDHTCALTAAGAVTCWGDDAFGQLGNGDPRSDAFAPTAPIALPQVNGAPTTATAIAAGQNHTCAVLNTGDVACWGQNDVGQLGLGAAGGDFETSPAGPVQLPSVGGNPTTATAISAGSSHTCAVLNTGDVTCWGSDSSGQLGNGGANENDPSPSAPLLLPGDRTANEVSAGRDHTCAVLDNGAVTCWGSDADGQLGNGPGSANVTAPSGTISLPNGATAAAVSSGNAHTCARLSGGALTCWGADFFGQLGNGLAGSEEAPNGTIDLGTNTTALDVAASAGHTCAVLNTGAATCWGNDAFGQLGNGPSADNVVAPSGAVALPGGASAIAMSLGLRHSCALLAGGDITCWGADGSGQLGIDGDGSNVDTPLEVVDIPVTPHNPPPGGMDDVGVVTVAPGRLVETRLGLSTVDGEQNGIGPRAARQVTTVNVWDRAGVPSGATAALVNIGAVNPALQGFITAYPCDADQPEASTLNYATGQTISNGAVIALSATGTLCVYTHRAMDLIVDVTGYTPADTVVETNTPARLLETRTGRDTIDGQSEGIGQRAARQVTEVQVTGRAGIDATATAAILNIAAISPLLQGFITVFPCDAAERPEASTLNYAAGQTIANGGIFALSATGTICIYTHRAMDLIVDVTGSLPDTDAVNPIIPARFLETRQGSPTFDGQSQGIGLRAARQVTTLQVAGRGDIPDDATSAILNIATINPALQGFITVYPCDVDRPEASTLNYQAGQTIANNAVIALSASGTICVYTHRQMDLIVDITGWT